MQEQMVKEGKRLCRMFKNVAMVSPGGEDLVIADLKRSPRTAVEKAMVAWANPIRSQGTV